MKEAAAIEATLHNYKPIRGRKCWQIILEIPAEHIISTMQTLGNPDADEIRVAVVRLNNEVVEQNQQAADSDLPAFLQEKESA